MKQETANRLFEYRKKNGFSQEELAEKIGVSRQAVSKWERGEASPDTENLIMLAKVYNVTLDELIMGETEPQKSEVDDDACDEAEEATAEDNGKINIDTDKGDKVSIGMHGIHVEDRNGDKVHIGWNGVHVDSETDNTHVHIGKGGHVEFNWDEEKTPLHRFFERFPFPLLAVIAYLLFGIFNMCGGWALGWMIFLTIPLYYSLVSAVFSKDPNHFAWSVLITAVFLFGGFYYNAWHPLWLLFLTIPLYYTICIAIKKMVTKMSEKFNNK